MSSNEESGTNFAENETLNASSSVSKSENDPQAQQSAESIGNNDIRNLEREDKALFRPAEGCSSSADTTSTDLQIELLQNYDTVAYEQTLKNFPTAVQCVKLLTRIPETDDKERFSKVFDYFSFGLNSEDKDFLRQNWEILRQSEEGQRVLIEPMLKWLGDMLKTNIKEIYYHLEIIEELMTSSITGHREIAYRLLFQKPWEFEASPIKLSLVEKRKLEFMKEAKKGDMESFGSSVIDFTNLLKNIDFEITCEEDFCNLLEDFQVLICRWSDGSENAVDLRKNQLYDCYKEFMATHRSLFMLAGSRSKQTCLLDILHLQYMGHKQSQESMLAYLKLVENKGIDNKIYKIAQELCNIGSALQSNAKESEKNKIKSNLKDGYLEIELD